MTSTDSSSNPEGEDPSTPDVFSHLYAHGQAHKEKRSQMSQTLIDKECTFRPTLVSQQIEREPDIDKLVNSKQVFRDTLENVKQAMEANLRQFHTPTINSNIPVER